MSARAEIEIEVPTTVYDGEHEDNGAGVCVRCSRKLPTSYWCDGNQQTHPGGTICIDGVSGRYMGTYDAEYCHNARVLPLAVVLKVQGNLLFWIKHYLPPFSETDEDGGWEYEIDRVYWQTTGAPLDETERDLFFDEIHAAAVERLRGRW